MEKVAKTETDGIIARTTGGGVNKLFPPGGMAEWTMATVLKTGALDEKMEATPRIISTIDWAFAPDWLTVSQACELAGYDRGFMLRVVDAGGVDLDIQGRIEKRSLWEWLEASLEVDQFLASCS